MYENLKNFFFKLVSKKNLIRKKILINYAFNYDKKLIMVKKIDYVPLKKIFQKLYLPFSTIIIIIYYFCLLIKN